MKLIKKLVNKIRSLKIIFRDIFWLKIIWRIHVWLVRLLHGRVPANTTFSKLGVRQGEVPSNLVDSFKLIINQFEKVPFSIESCVSGFRSGLQTTDKYEFLNQSHIYLEPNREQLFLLTPLLVLLKQPLEECLGYPSKVVNVRFWKTPPAALEKGPNHWHKDGMPREIMKLLLYFSDVSIERGSTEIILKDDTHHVVEGPAGTWVLFLNSSLLHRGMAPKSGERIICEVTLVPAYHNDFLPVFSGQNAQFPLFPWSVKK